MKNLIANIYMFIFHPVLFFRYSLKAESTGFLIKGKSLKLQTKYFKPGKYVRFGSGTRIQSYLGEKMIVGNSTYIVNNCSFLIGGPINIGNNVLIASNVLITSENHQINPEDKMSYGQQPLVAKGVTISDGCWIGEKVVILPGVNIGKKCVIGAGSVVSHSIPDYSIAVGNPARIIKRYDFDKHKWIRCE